MNLMPIVEHPSGEFRSSLEAMTEAFRRIRSCGETERWAVLSGQGQGSRLDSYRIADVRFRNGRFEFSEPVTKIATLAESVGIDSEHFESSSDLKAVNVANTSPDKLAKLLDAIYRKQFGIGPHEGEHDYAFGAEWS